MNPPIFYSLIYSPWSEKARWALDHHKIAYKKKEYMPLFGATGLKLRTGRLTQKITVPLLKIGKTCYFDSLDIARYAEAHGEGQSLFGEMLPEVEAWNQKSEKTLAAGRALLTFRVAQDKTAMQDYLPPWIPSWLGYSVGIVIAKTGIAYFRKKYAFQEAQPDEWLKTLRHGLVLLDNGLQSKNYIFEDFSYADIAMSSILQFVKPVTWKTIKTPKRSRSCWATPELAQEFPQLLDWRDALYQKHRLD